MTSVRTFMTLVTLGAAGAGYVYLNRTPVNGDPSVTKSDLSTLFDWNRNAGSGSRVPAQDLVQQIHEHTRSILDEMTKQHAGHSDAPVDDAFQRLQQVTQSAILASNAADVSSHETLGSSKNTVVPLPTLDELQRTAFDPAADKDPTSDSEIQSAQGRDDSISKSPSTASGAKTNALEPTSPTNRPGLVQTGESNSVVISTPISNTSQTTVKTGAKRVAGATPSKEKSAKIPYEWKVIGKTTEGRPIHSVHLGEGGTRTMVIAGLNGEDRTAVRWLELLVDEVARHPESLKNNEIVFVRAGNPDGLVQLRKENSRGVDINRNFPSRRYRPAVDSPKFAVPASEIETRVILDTLYKFRPRRVIHLAATSDRSQVLYNRLAKNAAVEFERTSKVTVSPLDTELYPGSLEDFAEGTLEATVLSMRLSVANDWNQSWTKLQPHVLTAVVGHSFDSSWSDAEQVFDPDRTPIPPTNVEPVSRQPQRRGYEELPPPPE